MENQHNGFNISTKAVNETHGIKHWIGGLGIGFQLVDKLSELFGIVCHIGSLFGVKQPVNEEFLLIAVETIVEEAAKGLL
jgi:D-alanyl-lipoteichoic acid acyltransferase DltB (MBOAT superfamily)